MSEDGDFQTTAPRRSETPKRRRSHDGGTNKRVAEQASTSSKQHKQPKIEEADPPFILMEDGGDDKSIDIDTAEYESKERSEMGREYDDDYGDEDDDVDWEEVSVPAAEKSKGEEEEPEDINEEEELSGPWQYNAVEIVFDKPLEEVKK
ncbi:hypothetical protein BGX28_002292 [Mortierella sp. GBA30]|nr:hypothetical protein BGX28_002292 [Mortierella sp. GBA30]